MKYVVEAYHAYDAPSERKHIVICRFDDPDKALACAKEVVDSYLRQELSRGKSPAEARKMYSCFGEIPMISGEPHIDFNSSDYADARTSQLSLEKQIINLAENIVISPLELQPLQQDNSTAKTLNPVSIGKTGGRFMCVFAWIIGAIIFLMLGLALRSAGEHIGVPSNIDYGEALTFTVGSGHTSYEEERSGDLTSYGIFTMVLALMIAARIGISIFKRRIDGGYSKHDNIRFIACLVGVLAAAIAGALLFLAFRGFSGWVASKLHFILEVSSWVAIWFLIKKWNRDE